jgi:hypothetical protein
MYWALYRSLTTFSRYKPLGFEVRTAVCTKIAVFWVVAPCSVVEVYQRFRYKPVLDSVMNRFYCICKKTSHIVMQTFIPVHPQCPYNAMPPPPLKHYELLILLPSQGLGPLGPFRDS